MREIHGQKDVDNTHRLEFAIDADCQALMGELVDDVERAVPAAMVSAILDEVIRPDVIGTGRRRIQKPSVSHRAHV